MAANGGLESCFRCRTWRFATLNAYFAAGDEGFGTGARYFRSGNGRFPRGNACFRRGNSHFPIRDCYFRMEAVFFATGNGSSTCTRAVFPSREEAFVTDDGAFTIFRGAFTTGGVSGEPLYGRPLPGRGHREIMH